MRSLRVAAVALATAVVFSATASATADEMLRPHHLKKKAAHWNANATPGVPGPANARGKQLRIKVLGHDDPGGPHGDVFVHKGFAYMGSWGLFDDSGEFCRALGVRAYDLSDPTDPELVSTFARRASDPRLAKSWTEKVQVRTVKNRSFRGDLAVVSFQDCAPGGFTGIGLYDVTRPERPRAAVPAPERDLRRP